MCCYRVVRVVVNDASKQIRIGSELDPK
jgi:hypothetical protein